MKYHALFVIFEKSSKIRNCRLLQIIGGALRVKLCNLLQTGSKSNKNKKITDVCIVENGK